MALTKVGETIGGEITAINRHRRKLTLILDSGAEAWLAIHHLDIEPSRQEEYFDSLEEGNELQVKVIGVVEKFGRPNIYRVSERMDVPLEVTKSVSESESADAEPDPDLVARFPVGLKLSAPVDHIRGTIIYIVIGDVLARLPVAELNGKKLTSLRVKVNVRFRVQCVNGVGVWLTCREIG